MSTVVKKISEGLLYSSGSRVIIKFFSAIGYFLVINRLSIHDYGVFVILLATISPLSTLIFFSLDRLFVSTCAQARGKNEIGRLKGLIREYFQLVAVCTIFVLLCTFGLHFFLKGASWAIYFWPLGLFLFSQIVMNVFSLFLEAHEKFKEISIVESFESISRCFVVIICAFVFHFSVTTVLVLYSLGKIAASLVSLRYVIPLILELKRHKEVRQQNTLKSLIQSFGKWEIARAMLEQGITPLRLWIIKFFVQVEGVAIFDFARSMYGVVSGLVPLKRILFPIISRFVKDKEKGFIIVMKAKKFIFFTYCFFYLGLAITLPFALPIFFPAYSSHTLFVLFVMLHLFVDVYKLAQDAVIYAFQEQKFLFQATPFFLLLQILVDIASMRIFGVIGVAISWHVGAFLTGFFTNWYLYHKQHLKKYSWKMYFRYDEYDRIIIGSVITRLPRWVRGFFSDRFKIPSL